MRFNENVTTYHYFGYCQPPDVTFVIGTEEFRCHKKVLANISEYFWAMFCSGFKEKDQCRVSIYEQPVIFKILLDLMYTGQLRDQRLLFLSSCCKRNDPPCADCRDRRRSSMLPVYHVPCCIDSKLWLRCTSLLELADKYDVLEKTIGVLEKYFRDRLKGGFRCSCDGIVLLMGMLYSMDKLKGVRGNFIFHVKAAISTLKEVHPDLVFGPDHLEWLMSTPLSSEDACNFTLEPQEQLTTPSSDPIVHKFGIEKLSDVTFVIGRDHFKCHKMILAARTSYFETMFFPGSNETNPDVLNLEEDPAAFGHLMDILYNGSFFGWREVIGCHESLNNIQRGSKNAPSSPFCPVIPKLWTTCSSLMKLAEKFGVRAQVADFLEASFMRSMGFVPEQNRKNLCSCVGAKFIFAAVYGLYEYKKSIYIGMNVVARAASVIKKLDPDLTFDLDTFQLLLTNVLDSY